MHNKQRAKMNFSMLFFAANNVDTQLTSSNYEIEIEVAKHADEKGYSAIWTPERHFQNFGANYPCPSILSAALAMITKNIHVRGGSVVLPLHHPTRVAEEWGVVDKLSNGRAGLAIASGWHKADFILNPDKYNDRKEIAYDGINQLCELWKGNPIIVGAQDGQSDPLEIRTYPVPANKKIPIWLTSGGSNETWKKAGELGVNILGSIGTMEELKNNIATYRQARKDNNHNPEDGVVTIMAHTYVCDTENEAVAVAKAPLLNYLETYLEQKKQHVKLKNLEKYKDIKDELWNELREHTYNDFYQSKSLIGSIDKCSKFVESLADVGVNELACLINFGIPKSSILKALKNLDKLVVKYSS